MTETSFYKMSGSGNDFVVLDGRETSPEEWPAERVAAICHRRLGVGGDGLVILTPEEDDLRMIYLNSDGGRVALCGNAALCCTRLAAHLGIARPEGMKLRTDSGVLATRCVGEGHLAELQLPPFVAGPKPGIALAEGERDCWFGTVGVPHLIVLVGDTGRVDVTTRGSELRRHPHFAPQGTNVNFVGTAAGARGQWKIRTFERGIEGETLACGTGTVAAAFSLAQAGLGAFPMEFETGSGNLLTVSGTLEGEGQLVGWLRGEGRLVFQGSWKCEV